jgi:hypothetical protein
MALQTEAPDQQSVYRPVHWPMINLRHVTHVCPVIGWSKEVEQPMPTSNMNSVRGDFKRSSGSNPRPPRVAMYSRLQTM